MDMSEVKAFNSELSGLYENKPPISKAKMSAITKGAIKAIKFYKHVVHSVEKFIQKCKPEYKVPGLYVIDSIVRQSRHQFGQDKDVFAPRFAKNMQQTFANLFRCPPEDKRNIIRVLNLWQKNHVFSADVIQPLMDMADPNHPLHQEIQQQNSNSNGGSLNISHSADNKTSPAPPQQHTPHNSTPHDQEQSSGGSAVKFNRKLLNDFEYESEDDTHDHHSDHHSEPSQTQSAADTLGSILTNPEIMRQLQSLQAQMQMMTGMPISNLMPMVSDMHNQNQNLPFLNSQQDPQKSGEQKDDMANESDIEFVETGPQVIEIPDANDSRSPTPSKSRRHRSRSRSPKSRSRRRSKSRSRSPRKDRRRDRERDREREKDREKTLKEREAEKEKQKEREKKGLPPIKKDNLSVCSTTLWVGHLSKLATPEELSDLFGEVGGVLTIDVVAPRGCAFVVMERRRDAAKAISKLNKHKLLSKEITVAWAPGKGVKGREWKDYWEGEWGVSYLPWGRLHEQWQLALLSLDALEDGGVVDEDTLPPWMPPRIIPKPLMDGMGGMLPPPGLPPGLPPPSLPPPGLPPPGLPPPGIPLPASMPTVAPPNPMPPMPRMPPPGIPGGLPAGLPALPAGLPALPAGLPALPAAVPGGMVGGFLGGLMGLSGLLPMHIHHHHQQHPHQLPALNHHHNNTEAHTEDDAMDLDTEEAPAEDPSGNEPKTDTALCLPDQLQALLSKPPPNFNTSEPPPKFTPEPQPFVDNQQEPNDDKSRTDRDRERRDRDRRDRDRRDRRGGRDRDRDREDRRGDRDRDRDRGRDRRDRDKDRDRYTSRENNNRERAPPTGPEQVQEKTLQERLWEMANGKPRQKEDKRQEDGARLEEKYNEGPPRHLPSRHDHPPPLLDTPDMEKPEEETGWTQLAVPPQLAPTFRAELRMRGPPRPPVRGPWLEGPFGPRFNGMPPFNRPPFEGPPPMFDGPPRFERPPFNRMPFDGPRPPFDGLRPPFDGPRPPFDGSRPPFDDGPRPPFDGARPPFEGPRPAYDVPMPDYEGPDRSRFEGPPEFFDRNDRRFDEREPFGDRGWNGERDDRDREWDRRPEEWDDRRRDRRPRDREDRDRRRGFEDRARTNREERNPRRDRDRKSRWGAAEEADGDAEYRRMSGAAEPVPQTDEKEAEEPRNVDKDNDTREESSHEQDNTENAIVPQREGGREQIIDPDEFSIETGGLYEGDEHLDKEAINTAGFDPPPLPTSPYPTDQTEKPNGPQTDDIFTSEETAKGTPQPADNNENSSDMGLEAA